MTSAPTSIVNLQEVETTPGAACVMAPDDGQELTDDEYKDLMRRRWKHDLGARQHMTIFALRYTANPRAIPINVFGPHAETARAILRAIAAGRLP